MKSKRRTYFDYNATTPVRPEVVEAMLPYFGERFGNPSSAEHGYGWEAEEAVGQARAEVARLVGARPSEIVFTSGATEGANLALLGYCLNHKGPRRHILSAPTEHRAVRDTLEYLNGRGFEIEWLPVGSDGLIANAALEKGIRADTLMVCLMQANNETGVIFPVREWSRAAVRQEAVFACDITQAVGKIPVELSATDIGLAFFSSHKVYGPKGVGALYIQGGIAREIRPLFSGGGQEGGLRPGTLNVPGIVGFGKACSLIAGEWESEACRLKALRERIEAGLRQIGGIRINGAGVERLPNTISATFPGLDGNLLIRRLNRFALSRGSACSSNLETPSHVLRAMGLSEEDGRSSIRISMGRGTRPEEADELLAAIVETVNLLKSEGV